MQLHDIYRIIDHALLFLRSHLKVVIIGIVAFIALCLVSCWMTQQSISYSPLKIFDGSDVQTNELEIPYSKRMSYSESVTIPSLIIGSVSDINETISTISSAVDTASILDNLSGGSGTLLIPEGASKIGYSDLGIYGWAKHYSIVFNQIDCTDAIIVFVAGNSIISGKLSVGTGILSEITVYQ
ncbi:hypothetical protein OBV_14360 [Oscillibacter valericigenes Sjm18-20]|nr:hypothetical protein OBV_14360 [Oscillibacter valericigenes Sjm18-20]